MKKIPTITRGYLKTFNKFLNMPLINHRKWGAVTRNYLDDYTFSDKEWWDSLEYSCISAARAYTYSQKKVQRNLREMKPHLELLRNLVPLRVAKHSAYPYIFAVKKPFTAWKFAYARRWDSKRLREIQVPVLLRLKIPAGALVHIHLGFFSDIGNSVKMRASRVRVVSAHHRTMRHNKHFKPQRGVRIEGWRDQHPAFQYKVGKIARPRRQFSMNDLRCASGIHFFLHKKEAFDWA